MPIRILSVCFTAMMLLAQSVIGQTLPKSLRGYLNRNYGGWKLAGECYPKGSENKRVLAGDFDGNGKKDYAVKFVRGTKGFLVAFLADRNQWKPIYLHIWKKADEAKFSDLMLFDKGDQYELGESNFKLKFDAPADFRCESDVGGIHVYRNGKFIEY
jgi:hypothetical protein